MKKFKKLLILCLTLLTAQVLTVTAHADAIADPVTIFTMSAVRWLPLVLVILVVIITVILLLKYRKKK